MTMKIQFLALDSYNNVVGLKRLMGSETSPLDNWISNDYTNIKKP
jgi:hypothetical protein